MRVLRTSMWFPGPDPSRPLPLASPVVLESDCRDTLEAFLTGLYDEGVEQRPEPAGCFITHEIVEVPGLEPDDPTALMKASGAVMANIGNDHECAMAVAYFFLVSNLERLKAEGRIVMPGPHPITTDDYRFIFNQVRKHSAYHGQKIVALRCADDADIEFPEDE